MAALITIGDSLREAFFMFWETLWALILGFALAGAVQAFVSRGQMQRVMGNGGPAALTRSSLLGMASSSCSYAASALAKSLFQRGADFTAAMVFMVASTNLVAELGVVLWLLIGWRFTLAEFIGGAIMIALLGIALPRLVSRRLIIGARERLGQAEAGAGAQHEEHAGHEEYGAHGGHDEPDSLARRLRQPARWADAAGYAISDLTMLRREIVIGFIAAGFAAAAVPGWVWNGVFLHGHGVLTMVENAIVGPFVAMISFVCSIGNVPLAAALWKDGISFGGVVAFILADLISLPLLFVYRKLYGGRLTLRLLGVFWLVMSAAGLITEVLFRVAGAVPTVRPVTIAPSRFGWDYTTILNIVFLAVLAGLYWLHRSRKRFGGGQDVARDPVCGMQVEKENPGAVLPAGGRTVYFCSEHCRDRFQAENRQVDHDPAAARS
jgi:uncharacterized membrane protein YraQ (UPF0718 family)/YHS domain-containing protein